MKLFHFETVFGLSSSVLSSLTGSGFPEWLFRYVGPGLRKAIISKMVVKNRAKYSFSLLKRQLAESLVTDYKYCFKSSSIHFYSRESWGAFSSVQSLRNFFLLQFSPPLDFLSLQCVSLYQYLSSEGLSLALMVCSHLYFWNNPVVVNPLRTNSKAWIALCSRALLTLHCWCFSLIKSEEASVTS